jgi:iron complex outermembrane receptor protein
LVTVLLGGASLLAITSAAQADDVKVQVASAADGPVQVASAASYAPNGGGIETVTVTARHRKEDAQQVPISLSVVNTEALEAAGISNSRDYIQLVPSLQVISTNPRNTTILVRGLGSNVGTTNDGLEAGVGVYVDGVLYSRPATTTFDQAEIGSLEELRGPQGTLFGKNAIAGAINITTPLPTSTLTAGASVEIGNYDYKKENAFVSGPLNDSGTLTYRVSGHYSDRDGFGWNTVKNQSVQDYHDYGLKTQLYYQPTDDFTLRIIGDYDKQKSRTAVQYTVGYVYKLDNGVAVPRPYLTRAAQAGYTPLAVDPFARETDLNSEVHIRMEQGGLSSQADWTVSGFTLTSISAYRFWNWDPSNDADNTALSVLTQARQQNQERQFTQELRVTSPAGESFEYTGGLYYYWEQDDGFGKTSYGDAAPLWLIGVSNPVYQAALNGFTVNSRSIPRINSYAAYGQATWHILPELDFTGGFRYTYEYKTGGYSQVVSGADLSSLTTAQQATAQAIRSSFGVNNAYSVHTSNNLLGGLASLTYKVSDELNLYASYSHGEKSAGLNLSNLPTTVPKVIDPESIDNYEIGWKSTLLGGKVTFNADAFWADDSNYQSTILSTGSGTTFVTYISNIPSVRTRGVEADIVAQIAEGLSVNFSSAYTDATYVSYPNAPAPFEQYYTLANPTVFNSNATRDLSGKPLPVVSKWVFSGGLQYNHSLAPVGISGADGYFNFNTSYRSDSYSSASDSIYSIVPAHEVTNAQIGIRTNDEHWDLSVWSRNIFNTDYYISRGVGGFNTGIITGLLGDPRTFGVTLKARY